MRNVIKYYYNIYIDKIDEYTDYSIFLSAGEIYIIKSIIPNDDILKIYTLLNNPNQITHIIIPNNNNEFFTSYNNKYYLLMKFVDNQKVIDNDLYYCNYIVEENKNDIIPELWSKKIDYYMEEIRKIAVDKEILLDAFNYYIGLAENAISIYNRELKKLGHVRYVIAHRRIKYPNYSINYNDPTNLLIDSISRDISEYIKGKYINETIELQEVINLVYQYNLNQDEITLLFSRLLYPSYFFDELDKIISGEYHEKVIKTIVLNRDKMERILKDFYFYFKKNNHFPEIEWLNS